MYNISKMNKIDVIKNPRTPRDRMYNQSRGTLISFVNQWFYNERIHYPYDYLCGEAIWKFYKMYAAYQENKPKRIAEGKPIGTFNTYLTGGLFNHTITLMGDGEKTETFLTPYDAVGTRELEEERSDFANRWLAVNDNGLDNFEFGTELETLYNKLDEASRLFLNKLVEGKPLQGYRTARQEELKERIRNTYNNMTGQAL